MKPVKRIPYSIAQKLMERKLKKVGGKGAVLVFHQVNNDLSSWDDEGCAITASSFKEIIDSIPVAGNIVKIPKHKALEGIYLTFDDAYDDVYTTVLPILRERNVPFTVFVTPGLIDKGRYLTLKHFLELAKEPLCTIGAHSMNHKMLRWLPEEIAKGEIEESKKVLQALIDKPVDVFAYPYGSVYACSKKNISQAKEVYKLAFSTLHSPLNSASVSNLWFLPRYNVCEENAKLILKEFYNVQN